MDVTLPGWCVISGIRYLLIVMLKVLFKMLYLENQHNVWCQPCHVPVSLEIWHQSQWFRVEKGTGKQTVRIYFSICNSTLDVGEVTVQRKAAYIDNVLYIIENFPYFLKVCNC